MAQDPKKPLVIQTWNKLWSRPESEQSTIIARSSSIHPGKALGRARAEGRKTK